MKASWTCLLATAALTAACEAPQPSFPPVQAETEHFVYRAEPGFVHPLALEWLERQHDALTRYLGVELEPDERLTYVYTASSLALIQDTCGESTFGCALEGGVAIARTPLNIHELVHLYAYRIGRPPAFFEEGLADVLGCHPLVGARPIPRSDEVLDLMTETGFRDALTMRSFEQAAGFVRFLLDRHGREAFLDFYARVPKNASFDRVADEFRSVFGESLEVVVQAWVAGPPQRFPELCMHQTLCDVPPIDEGGAAQEPFQRGLGSASHPRVLLRSLELDQRTDVRVRVDAEVGTRVAMLSCDGGFRASRVGAALSPGVGEMWTDLDPGRYVVRITDASVPADPSPTTLQLSADIASDPIRDRCTDAPGPEIDGEVREVVLRGRFDGTADDLGEPGLPDRVLTWSLARSRHLWVENRVQPGSDEEPFDGELLHLCEGSCAVDDPSVCETGVIGPGSDGVFDVPYNGRLLEAGVGWRAVLEGDATDAGYLLGLRLSPP